MNQTCPHLPVKKQKLATLELATPDLWSSQQVVKKDFQEDILEEDFGAVRRWCKLANLKTFRLRQQDKNALLLMQFHKKDTLIQERGRIATSREVFPVIQGTCHMHFYILITSSAWVVFFQTSCNMGGEIGVPFFLQKINHIFSKINDASLLAQGEVG